MGKLWRRYVGLGLHDWVSGSHREQVLRKMARSMNRPCIRYAKGVLQALLRELK